MEILSVAVTLFLIMDPFGNTPVFLSILEKVQESRRRQILIRELLIALAIIIGFTFAGKPVMAFLGLAREAVSIAGGIILFLIAVRMVFPTRDKFGGDDPEGEPLLVPLAVPLTSGPSLLATLLLFSSTGQLTQFELLGAAAMAWCGTFVILVSSTFFVRYLRGRGLAAVERLMGMVLVALSVQMFLDGLSSYVR